MLCAAHCPLCFFAFPLGRRPIVVAVLLFDASVMRLLGFSASLVFLPVAEGPRFPWFFVWLLLVPLPVWCCLPSPAVGPVWRPGPVFHAGASLWASGCSCDGSVALLLCWECGCALSSFRLLSHGNKG